MENILFFKIYLYMTTQERMIILDLMSYHAAQNIFYLLKHKQSSSLHDVIHERPQYSTSCSYSAVSSLLSILLASLEPLTEATLHAAHSALYCGAPALSATQVIHPALLSSSVTYLQVRDLLSPLAELVVTRSDGSLMCIHPTLRSACL